MAEPSEGLSLGAAAPESSVTDILKLLLMERKERAEEVAEERRRRDAEAEQHRRDMQEQVRLMQRLVEEASRREREALSPSTLASALAGSPSLPKLTKLSEQDDIEAYLTTFEKMMVAYTVPRERWTYMLAPQLTGKAQKAFAALDASETGNYDVLKEAILRRFNINEEAYRQRFRSITKGADETYRELASRLMDLATKWAREYTTREEVLEIVTTEQLINTMPDEMRVWVRERKPKTSVQAGDLADDYVQARKIGEKKTLPHKFDGDKRPTTGNSLPRRCYNCGETTHLASDCRKATKLADGAPKNQRADKKELKCYNCGKLGHVAMRCPAKALYCGEKQRQLKDEYGPREGAITRSGLVEGSTVDDIVIDTGCSRTLVRSDLIPQARPWKGEIIVRCAHGDAVRYPTADVQISVGKCQMTVEAGVSDTLPASVLLGTDVPHLLELLVPKEDPRPEEALAVSTRARAKAQETEAAIQQRAEQESGVAPNPMVALEEATTASDAGSPVSKEDLMGASFDPDIFLQTKERRKVSKRQKRMDRRRHSKEANVSGLDINATELQELQEADTTLAEAHKAADGGSSTAGRGFFKQNGLLYRRWTPPGRDCELMSVDQLVLPLQCRQAVLKLAHSIPVAGHFGKTKTAQRILQRFYWPTVFRDVQEFCRSCADCQKCSTRKGPRAPLVPLPVIDVPFTLLKMGCSLSTPC